MINHHGWEVMENVIQATLSFLHRKAPSNMNLQAILNRALLIEMLQDYPCDFLLTKLGDFANDFTKVLEHTKLRVSG